MKASCGKCGSWWTGAQRSHCGGCHLTFSSLGSFDAHQRNVPVGNTCADPAVKKLVPVEKEYGILWSYPSKPVEEVEDCCDEVHWRD